MDELNGIHRLKRQRALWFSQWNLERSNVFFHAKPKEIETGLMYEFIKNKLSDYTITEKCRV